MKNIIKWSSFLIIFLLALGLAGSGFAQTFQTSDFDGNWYVYSIEVDPNMPAVYWVWGKIGVESGNLSGAYYGPDGSSTTLSSGQIALDNKGIITGSLEAGESTSTIVHGKLDPSKTKGDSVFFGVKDGTMDLATFIKEAGTFIASDIQGSWYQYVMVIDPATGAVYWAYGLLDVDGSGNATGDFTGADGSIVSVNGTLSLDNGGIISGTATLSADGSSTTSEIVHGKLDQSKTSGAYVSINQSDSSMFIGYLIKSGGTFKQADLSGNWYVYTMNIDPNIPAVYWAYGKAGINGLGNLTGFYISPFGQTINLTASFQMNSAGLSSGIFNFNTGDSGIVPSIKLDQGKTSMAGVGIITSGSSVGAMSILHFIKESNMVLPGIPLLLLDD